MKKLSALIMIMGALFIITSCGSVYSQSQHKPKDHSLTPGFPNGNYENHDKDHDRDRDGYHNRHNRHDHNGNHHDNDRHHENHNKHKWDSHGSKHKEKRHHENPNGKKPKKRDHNW